MSKSTVVFNTNQVVVEGGKPWLDSEGNEAYPEVIFGSDVSERLEKAEALLGRIRQVAIHTPQGNAVIPSSMLGVTMEELPDDHM